MCRGDDKTVYLLRVRKIRFSGLALEKRAKSVTKSFFLKKSQFFETGKSFVQMLEKVSLNNNWVSVRSYNLKNVETHPNHN